MPTTCARPLRFPAPPIPPEQVKTILAKYPPRPKEGHYQIQLTPEASKRLQTEADALCSNPSTIAARMLETLLLKASPAPSTSSSPASRPCPDPYSISRSLGKSKRANTATRPHSPAATEAPAKR